MSGCEHITGKGFLLMSCYSCHKIKPSSHPFGWTKCQEILLFLLSVQMKN